MVTTKASLSAKMDLSPLNKLPGELRNRVYELVANFPGGLHLRKHNRRRFNERKFFSWSEHNIAPRKPNFSDVMALSRTCRKIRKESLGIFYSINTLTFYPRLWRFGLKMTREQIRSYCSDLAVLRQWLKGIGRVSAASIRNLVLDLGEWDTDAVHTVYSPGSERHNMVYRSDTSNREWWQLPRKLERKIIHPYIKPDSISIGVQLNSLPNSPEVRNFRASLWNLEQSGKPQKRPSWYQDYTTYLISATDRSEAKKQIQQLYMQQWRELEEYIDQTFGVGDRFYEVLPSFWVYAEFNRNTMIRAIGERNDGMQNPLADRIAALEVD